MNASMSKRVVGVYVQIEVLALKVAMTSVFASDGSTVPATLLQVLPATIVQFLEYGKALVAFGESRSRRFRT